MSGPGLGASDPTGIFKPSGFGVILVQKALPPLFCVGGVGSYAVLLYYYLEDHGT